MLVVLELSWLMLYTSIVSCWTDAFSLVLLLVTEHFTSFYFETYCLEVTPHVRFYVAVSSAQFPEFSFK